MIELSQDECRVLGTLIEKALTTPGQYPLSLNSLVTGVNQKNNRDPVVEIDEDTALRAVDGLRSVSGRTLAVMGASGGVVGRLL